MKPLAPITTHVAHAGWDEHDYFGHKLFGELAGKQTYSALLGLAVAGATIAPDVVDMLDDIAAILALGEPRIWPLKLTRLGSAYGRTLPGIIVGDLCFETDYLGPLIFGPAAALFLEIERLPDAPSVVADITRRMADKRVPGFGVAFRDVDERLVALTDCVQRRGRGDRKYWKLATELWATLRASHGLIPNVAGAAAAVLLDCGFTPAQIGPLVFSLMQSVMLANAFEGAQQAPEVLRKLPDDTIDYVGKPARTSPRARAAAALQAGSIDRPEA